MKIGNIELVENHANRTIEVYRDGEHIDTTSKEKLLDGYLDFRRTFFRIKMACNLMKELSKLRQPE
jgi:hypothetical protein